MALDVELGDLLEQVQVEVRITHTFIPLVRLHWAMRLLRLAARIAPVRIIVSVEHSAAALTFYCTYCGRSFVWSGRGAPDCTRCGSQHLAVTDNGGNVTLYPANGPGACYDSQN